MTDKSGFLSKITEFFKDKFKDSLIQTEDPFEGFVDFYPNYKEHKGCSLRAYKEMVGMVSGILLQHREAKAMRSKVIFERAIGRDYAEPLMKRINHFARRLRAAYLYRTSCGLPVVYGLMVYLRNRKPYGHEAIFYFLVDERADVMEMRQKIKSLWKDDGVVSKYVEDEGRILPDRPLKNEVAHLRLSLDLPSTIRLYMDTIEHNSKDRTHIKTYDFFTEDKLSEHSTFGCVDSTFYEHPHSKF